MMKEIREGDLIGKRYLAEKEVTRGGMGIVYYAYDTHAEHARCVVKTPQSDHLHSTDFRIRFREEGQIGIRLANAAPHLFPQVYAILEETEHNCEAIVMERFDGKKFNDGSRTLSDLRVIEIILQVLEAVRIAANNGITLRDLKPSNVLCNEHGGVRVIDFGLAISPKSTFSKGGVGTNDFTAPEIKIHDKPGDVRSDLYSVGALLEDWILTPNRKSHDDIRAIADRLLEPEPENRFQQPEDVMIELVAVAERQDPRLSLAGPFNRIWGAPPLKVKKPEPISLATVLERVRHMFRFA